MALRFSDWKWACIAALGLLGVAAFIVFVIHPGEFEGQVGWFFGLLPGVFPAAVFSDFVYKIAPRAWPIANWSLIIGLSFLWYFTISYAVIKTCRFFARALKH